MTIYKSGKAVGIKTTENKPGQRTGRSKHPLYATWYAMWDRCTNKDSGGWSDYGGRGIRVCAEWADFETFLDDMGPKPTKSHTLEREDNEKDYSASNCKWATWKEQARNRRNTVLVEFQGRIMVLAEAIELGFKPPVCYKEENGVRVYNKDPIRAPIPAKTRGIQWVTKD